MEKITPLYRKIIGNVLFKLKEKGEIDIDELTNLKAKKDEIIPIIKNVLESTNIIKIEGDKLILNTNLDSQKNILLLSSFTSISVSEKGDRSFKTVKEITPIDQTDKIEHTIHKIDYPYSSKVVRCSNPKIFDPLTLGKVKGSCKKLQEGKLIKFYINFTPPLKVGQFAKYRYSTWEKEYFGLTISDIEKKYGIDYSYEGVAVVFPTHYVRIKINLPWIPSYANAFQTMRIPSEEGSDRLAFNLIKGVNYRFHNEENTLILELFNPPMGEYGIKWKPPK
ncbi:hypothetical protein [Acidianus manzaensis]|uniref:Uncharacterized protein n=1 Tax=Acidianus manzaensis TaxID=282676 RepID=A0A1W6JWN8_9CREN|nr:hypothetical protein [Acidianus manzaensis]ARM74650.1 hypothetical protein B6F84_00490 [Acidianus manzaensis]